MTSYQFTSLAVDDLFEIWSYIAGDNIEAATAVEDAIFRACAMIAKTPLAGRLRADLTQRPVRFWSVQPYYKYIIVYDPVTKPIQIIRVLHGARDLQALLR